MYAISRIHLALHSDTIGKVTLVKVCTSGQTVELYVRLTKTLIKITIILRFII